MSLSRRAKIDREAAARGAPRKTKPLPPEPEAVAAPAPGPAADVPPPAPVPEAEPPKRTRFVRPAAEKKAAAKPTAAAPRSTTPSGKLMSKLVPPAPPAGQSGLTRRGPKAGRIPVVNTPKRP